jgi:glycosyltransferase involved in cell wall biosynthesis
MFKYESRKSGEGFGKLFHYMKLFLRIIGALLFNSGDLIYVHYGSHPLVPLAWLLPLIKKPVVINFHGEDLVGDSGWEKKIRPMLRNVIEGSHLIVLPSEYFASIFSQRYQNPNVFISPSGGIDISKFRPLSSFNSNSVKRFGFVARIERGKGWLTMLRAIERKKPRWILAHDHVVFARSLLTNLGFKGKTGRKSLKLKKTPILNDLRVLDLYEDAIIDKDDVDLADREGNWVQKFQNTEDGSLFVGSQFFRYQEVEQFIEENFASGSPLPPTGGES